MGSILGLLFVENLRLDVLMVEYERSKIAVDAVVDVNFITLLISDGILLSPAGDDLTSNCESRRDVIASRFTNDTDVG